MAIIQSSMNEEILSRSEKAVIRGIYRASQLAEAKVSLEKTMLAFMNDQNRSAVETSINDHVKLLNAYFNHAISVALLSTKVPSFSQAEKVIPSTSS
jgi:hypothetical protein